jgi:hypothetical protein
LRLTCFLELHVHRPVFADQFVGPGFDSRHFNCRQRLTFEIHCRCFLPEMHPQGAPPEQLCNHGREEMLPGMLLHMVESAGPVDLADYPGLLQRRCEQVSYPVSLIHHVDDGDPAQLPSIEWLTA